MTYAVAVGLYVLCAIITYRLTWSALCPLTLPVVFFCLVVERGRKRLVADYEVTIWRKEKP